ncbi:hypothetical protein [Pseudonocardia sp. H11422]|uniref:hypothetical protein n=1 Tax=Pseudonocardia sp. H11422 TaxID=2835866 RepID=UPI001BDDC102|nr:hypothetical protein [Pseudonocardia sp. H11422]
MLAAILTQLALGGGLVLVGVWGRANAARLPPAVLPPEEVRRRARVLRRGGLACVVAGAVLAVTALLGLG